MARRALVALVAAAALAGCGSSTPKPAHPGPAGPLLHADLQVLGTASQGWTHAVSATPGESLSLRIPIRNDGQSQLPDLVATLRAPNELVVRPDTVVVQPVHIPALGRPIGGLLTPAGADLGPFPGESATQVQFVAVVAPHARPGTLTASARVSGGGQAAVGDVTVAVR